MKSSIFDVNNNCKLALPHGRGLIFISLDQLLYFSSDNIYCKMHLVDGQVLTILASIKDLELALCHQHLIRLHKQYLVNIDKILSYSKSEGGFVVIGEVQLPVSRVRREAFLNRFFGLNE